MFALDTVELTVTAVTGNNDCLCTRGSYLLNFSSPIKDAFVIIAGDQGTASATTTDLIHVGRLNETETYNPKTPKHDPAIHEPLGGRDLFVYNPAFLNSFSMSNLLRLSEMMSPTSNSPARLPITLVRSAFPDTFSLPTF